MAEMSVRLVAVEREVWSGTGTFVFARTTEGEIGILPHHQAQAARELLRVCRPSGKVGLANWPPDGFAGQGFRITAEYVPPPPGVLPPTRWGTEEGLRALFGTGVTSLHCTRRSVIFRYRSPHHYLEHQRTYFGPTIRAFEGLPAEQQERLSRAMLENIQHFNQSGDETMVVPSEYLEVVATTR